MLKFIILRSSPFELLIESQKPEGSDTGAKSKANFSISFEREAKRSSEAPTGFEKSMLIVDVKDLMSSKKSVEAIWERVGRQIMFY